jgi:hypothetical protein
LARDRVQLVSPVQLYVRIGTISTATTIALRCLVSERIRDRTESGL